MSSSGQHRAGVAAVSAAALSALRAQNPLSDTPGSEVSGVLYLFLLAALQADELGPFRVTAVNEQNLVVSEGDGDGGGGERHSGIAPPGWNASPDAFSVTFAHPRSALRFLVKAIQMGASRLLVTAVPQALEGGGSSSSEVGVGECRTCEFSLADEVDASCVTMTSGAVDWASGAVRRPESVLREFFSQILHYLVPGLVEAAGDSGNDSDTQQQVNTRTGRPGYYEGDEDPLRIGPPRGGRGGFGGVPAPGWPSPGNPGFGSGHSDLDPFHGAAPSGLGPFGPGGVPGGGPFGPGGPGGMHIGPQHPGFGRGVQPPFGPGAPPSAFGPHGHPPPPGARFDPYGPPASGFGEPGPDHMRPPGFNDDMYM